MTGLTDGEGGIARPSLGVRVPLFCLLPGIGGRSRGAGEDILRGLLGSGVWKVSITPLHVIDSKRMAKGSWTYWLR